MVQQSCHPDRSVPGFPATRHSPAATCAAFSKESRIKFANATNLNRKIRGSVVEGPAVFWFSRRPLGRILHCSGPKAWDKARDLQCQLPPPQKGLRRPLVGGRPIGESIEH
jgi:hypothetical protein